MEGRPLPWCERVGFGESSSGVHTPRLMKTNPFWPTSLDEDGWRPRARRWGDAEDEHGGAVGVFAFMCRLPSVVMWSVRLGGQ